MVVLGLLFKGDLKSTSILVRLLAVSFGQVLVGICRSADTVLVVVLVDTLDLVLSLLPLSSLTISIIVKK